MFQGHGSDNTYNIVFPQSNHENFNIDANGGLIRLFGDNTGTIMEWNEGGNVEIPNGELTISDATSGHISFANDDTARLFTSGSGSGKIQIRDANAGNSIVNFVEGGTVEIPNGNLNLGSNQLTNVGGTDCAAGEALLGDGSCGATSGGTQDLSDVLTQGNSANQTLDMGGNNITNVGTSDVDIQYDPGDDRMEINNNGNVDICIGSC